MPETNYIQEYSAIRNVRTIKIIISYTYVHGHDCQICVPV
jgi:hypothetical protein